MLAPGRQVACHRAEVLSLTGIAETTDTRTKAAHRRFDLYRIEWDKRVGNIKDPLGEER